MPHKVYTTPGIDLLFRAATFLLLPIISSILALEYVVLTATPDLAEPLGATRLKVFCVFGILFAYVSYTAARILVADWRLRKDAARMGAQLMPRVQSGWPGNVNVLFGRLKNMKTEYPGDGLLPIVSALGPTIDLNVLWTRAIFTMAPDHIKAVLATDFSNYEKGSSLNDLLAPLLGTGVFNSDGEMWKFHRSMTRPFFSRDRISHFDIFDRHAEVAIVKMKERMRSGVAMDFQDLMSRFTLDSATAFLFGSSVHSLEGDLPYPYNISRDVASQQTHGKDVMGQFSLAFFDASEVISRRMRLGNTWPLYEMFKDDLAPSKKIVDAFIEPIVEEAIKKKEAMGVQDEKPVDASGVDDDETLLDHLVRFTSDATILKDEVLNIMIAGRDTTAATLTIAVYFLAMYPDVMNRLRAEVLEKVGPTKRPTYEAIREMKYLRAVLNETLRLYPIVPFNIRSSINASTWPSPNPDEKPYYVPPNTRIIYSALMMQRRKDLWGPDAEEFDPDRFLDERLKKYLIPNSFAFLPFNAGPRICLGQQFAYNEMSFMLIRLLQNFDSFTLAPDSQPPATRPHAHWKEDAGTRKSIEQFYPRVTITLLAHGGLWLRAREAVEA